ncbi:MAG TPA: DUF4331 domain-containing protein [Candidatus Limnocylindrales bacterium]|nr:DUF4331 domain-containing protein [Candidatus Limnocylindrales bacterium]
MSTRSKVAALTGALVIATSSIGGVLASSHREAPLIAGDPSADNTDLYAFVNPSDPTKLTIIANYVPLQEPAGGPNFFPFDPTVRYEIKVDNNGDAKADVTYRFKFQTRNTANNFAGIPTFLYNDGPVTSPGDANLLVKQTYSVERNGVAIGSGLRTPPVNIGPRSTPNYAATAAQAVHALADGTKVFAGQRDDAFFVDLGSIFDLAGLRTFNPLHAIALPAEAGVDGVGGFNTNAIAIDVPLHHLTRDHAQPTGPNDPDAVLGIWATASRQQTRVLNANGTMSFMGPWVQVSRLGNPLVNEVIIPRVKKDYWNSQAPAGDAQFARYYKAPELTAVANVLYAALETPATANRNDLVAILLTGIDIPSSTVVPGGLQFTFTGPTQADLLRVNTGIKPNAAGACVFGVDGGGTPSRLGAIDGDLCGFPNGRRLLDDVTDIEVRALLEGYGPTLNAVLGVPNRSPNNLIGDGVDENDLPFLSAFPFIGTPHQGYEHGHHKLGPSPS